MNEIQASQLAMIAKEVSEHDCHNNDSGYEFKQLDVTENEYFVMVTIESGLKNDENTIASIFARTRRLITIGKKGKLTLLNGKTERKTKYGISHITGHAVFYSVVEH